MLVPEFYHITEFTSTENKIEAQIKLNKDHEIYRGHFPGQPVVPGVMQLQIIKELVEKARNRSFLMSDILSAKYLHMIIPGAFEILKVDIELIENEMHQIKFKAKVIEGEVIYTKVNAWLSLI